MSATPKLIIPPLGRVYDALRPVTEPLIRLMAGGSLAYHGYQILFGNIEGAARFFESVGFEQGVLWATVVGVLELLLPLTVGATVVIANHDEVVDGRALNSCLERHQATVMQATPVTWRLLFEAGWKPRHGFKALVGGEALPKDLADQLLAIRVAFGGIDHVDAGVERGAEDLLDGPLRHFLVADFRSAESERTDPNPGFAK